MPRVDFYILNNSETPENFLCALTGKIRREDLNIYINATDRKTAVMLDELLWTYKDISFLPHVMADAGEIENTPIAIGWDTTRPKTCEVLINLATDIPAYAGTFARIIEIVAAQDHTRAQARKRYRMYRDQGFELHSHDMES